MPSNSAKTLTRQWISIIAVIATTTAKAHTPYLAPTSFEPVMGNIVSFDASFAERFFIPETAFNNSQFQITTPTGKTLVPDTVAPLKTRVAVEHTLKDEGTYRLTTGARMGAEFYIYDLNGEEKRAMNPKEPPPKGATIKQHFRSVTRADTYITYKKPSNKALNVEDTGLQILPVSHPNEVFADEVLQIKLLHDGKPLSSHQLLAYPANAQSEPKPMEFTSDNKGIVNITLPQGKYLLRARYRAPAPNSADVPIYSHTTTLTLQVFENI